ncbi:MAG: hypothetical protein H6983_23830 [Ectothiorhodospiraceae bacterium]|nr:hypothetical protein [Chromatiales bacterium]MCP5157228.1 hypothetical protein [Ectothiorhodospiraceae bacterium]
MAKFVPGEPVTTETATVEVTQSLEDFLPPGRHRFQLVVEDDAGNRSDPDTVDIIVRDSVRPTAVLDAPSQVQPASSFTLSGKRSSDVAPGRVVKFEWTLLG